MLLRASLVVVEVAPQEMGQDQETNDDTWNGVPYDEGYHYTWDAFGNSCKTRSRNIGHGFGLAEL